MPALLLITQLSPEARLIAGVSTSNVFTARWLSAYFLLLNVFLQVVPATLSDGYTPPCRSVEDSNDQQPLPRRTPTVCCVHDTRLEHKVRQRPASGRRVGQNVRLVGPANCRRAQPSFVSHEVGYPRTPCGVRPLCREYGRCCRDWAGEASLHPHGHAVRQVSQASENVLLGRAIPARECACTRTRTTSA